MADFTVQPRVIRLGRKAIVDEKFRHLLGGSLKRDVHNRRTALTGNEAIQKDDQPFARLTGDDVQIEIGPVEAGLHNVIGFDLKRLGNLLRHRGCGGGGEGQHTADTQFPRERCQLQIVRPEIMAPFTDAVCLVHRQHRDLHLFQRPQESLVGKSFRGDEEHFQAAVAQIGIDLAGLFGGDA